jgi:hypothetical protein
VVALAGPFIVIAALVGAAGTLKLGRPATTARALGQMGLPSSAGLVRLGAGVEVAVAAGALAWGSRPFAAALALSYLGFAGFVVAALRRGVPLSSCGCFGVQDTPPTYGHVVLNLAAAGVATAVALGSPHGAALADLGAMDAPMLLRGVFLVLVAASTWFAYVALTLLPRLLAGARIPSESGR